jgi:hypothetical protein
VVKNIGNQPAGRSTLALKVGGETTPKTYTIPSLNPDERITRQRQVNLTFVRPYQYTATADCNNDVTESNENNNEKIEECRVVKPVKEDIVTFNPRTAEVKEIYGRWKIVDGSRMLFDFGNKRSEAERALAIIKHYRMNQSCFVGRPDPSFQYLLVSGRAPQGSYPGEDCVSFDPHKAQVKQISGRWKIVDGNRWVFDFGNKRDEAELALLIIKKYGFSKSCYLGRPDPSFTYLK